MRSADRQSIPSLAGLLATVFFAVMLLYLGRPLLVPLCFAGFIALVLYPFCLALEKKGLSRVGAILLCFLALSLALSVLIGMVVYQYQLFIQELPLLSAKVAPLAEELRQILKKTGIGDFNSPLRLRDLLTYSGVNIGSLVSTGVAGAITASINLVLIPVYAVLMLYYRHRLVSALSSLAGANNESHTANVVIKSVRVYGNYVKGMVWVYVIVGILNSIGLMLLGIKYAVLFGMLTAVMTIIPYAGIILSSLLPISMAWLTTGSLWYPLGVIAVFSIVQYFEGNFIYPYIVGRKVKVNVLASLISIFAGGLIWGVSGMVLFLPLVAVVRVIAEEFESLQPVRIFLSDN